MFSKFLKNYVEIGMTIAAIGGLATVTAMALHIIFHKQWMLDYFGTTGVLIMLSGLWTIAIGFVVSYFLKAK